MIQKLSIFIVFLTLFSCNHPEGRKYERNQGSKKEYNSSNYEINVNALESESKRNTIQESTKIKIQHLD